MLYFLGSRVGGGREVPPPGTWGAWSYVFLFTSYSRFSRISAHYGRCTHGHTQEDPCRSRSHPAHRGCRISPWQPRATHWACASCVRLGPWRMCDALRDRASCAARSFRGPSAELSRICTQTSQRARPHEFDRVACLTCLEGSLEGTRTAQAHAGSASCRCLDRLRTLGNRIEQPAQRWGFAVTYATRRERPWTLGAAADLL